MAEVASSPSRAAVAELMTELDTTRRDHARVQMQLSQLEALLQQQYEVVDRQGRQIQSLQAEVDSKVLEHRVAVTALQDGTAGTAHALEHQTHVMAAENAKLRSELAIAQAACEREAQLRKELLESQHAEEQLRGAKEVLEFKVSREAVEKTQAAERGFDARVAEAERRIRAEAYKALNEEAKLALQGNDQLQVLLQRQNNTIDVAMQRCKRLEAAQATFEQERAKSAAALTAAVSDGAKAMEQIADRDRTIAQLQSDLEQRRVERASLELVFLEYENCRKALGAEKQKAKRLTRDVQRWKEQATALTHQLGDTDLRSQSLRRLALMESRAAVLEENAERAQLRERHVTSARERDATAASLVAQLENGGGAPDPNTEGPARAGGSDDTSMASIMPRVAAVDILAIWHARYGDGADGGHAPDVPQPPPVALPPITEGPKPLKVAQERRLQDAKLSVLSQPGTVSLGRAHHTSLLQRVGAGAGDTPAPVAVPIPSKPSAPPRNANPGNAAGASFLAVSRLSR